MQEVIRKIEEKDLQECAVLLEKTYSDEPYNEKFQEGAAQMYIKSKFETCNEHSFVLINDTKVIGFVFTSLSYWADGPQFIMEEIVVDKKYRGQGFAQLLNQALEKHFKELDVTTGMLWVKKDSPANKFHKKNGYFNAEELIIMFKDF